MRKKFLCILLLFPVIVIGQKLKIHTDNMTNYWIAYDSVQTTQSTMKQQYYLQHLYLDKASKGFKDFIRSREVTAKKLLDNIKLYPAFWESVRTNTLAIKQHTGEVEDLMENFGKLYPEFKQPDVYFVIGAMNSGGTTSADMVLIGSELASANATTNADELGKWLQDVFKNNKNVVTIVAHELGHTQQKGGDAEDDGNSNLLGYCIREGACDFISELLLEQAITTPYLTYGKEHESELWRQFTKEMHGQDISNWLYNGNQAPQGVADLGYFVGYAICKSYYDKAKDKKQALKDIIELDYDPGSVERFLKQSGYNGGQ